MLQRIKCRMSAFLLDLRLSLDTEKEEKRMIKEQLVNLEVSFIFCTHSSLDIDFSVLNILTINYKCINFDSLCDMRCAFFPEIIKRTD